MVKLSDFQPIRETPENLIQIPTFIKGALAQAFIPEYEKARKGKDNFAFKRVDNSGVRKGSNVFNLGLANKVFANAGGKFRTPVPTDSVYQTIFPLVEDKFYTDLNALDVWGVEPSYERNLAIWRQVIKLAEQKKKDLRFPFRIQGFCCVPDESEKGYGVKIEPADNLRIIQDDKLSLPTETRFNSLDENGMINPEDSGRFTKYTLGNGLSRVCLYGVGDLVSYGDLLADSYDYGRVVLVDAEGVAPNFSLKEYVQEIQKAHERKVAEATRIRDGALESLRKL